MGELRFLFNPPLNDLVGGPPDASCSEDADCVRRCTRCEVCCQASTAVNKGWEPYCPFPKMPGVTCEMSSRPSGITTCVNGQCQVVQELPKRPTGGLG